MNKEHKKYLEDTLKISISAKQSSENIFTYNGIDFWLYHSEWEEESYHVDNRVIGRGKFGKNFPDLKTLCDYLIKNKDKITKKTLEAKRAVDRDFEEQNQLLRYIEGRKTSKMVRFDGQNIQIKTGKDAILVKMLLDTIERYESDQETIGLIYK